MFKKGIIFLVLLFGFGYQIVLSEYTVHDPAYCITNSSECDGNYNRPATEAEIKEIEAFNDAKATASKTIKTSNNGALQKYKNEVKKSGEGMIYVDGTKKTIADYTEELEEYNKKLTVKKFDYGYCISNPDDCDGNYNRPLTAQEKSEIKKPLKLDPFQQKEVDKYLSLKKEQEKAIQQVSDGGVVQSEEVKENKAHDFVNYIPEVQTLEKQYDIISNPNASDAEKKAAYKKLEAEGIDTGEGWFSDPDPVKIKAQIEQKKEKYTQKLPTDDEIIKRAREEYGIEDGKEYSSEEYAKVNARIAQLKTEKQQILVERENANIRVEALAEAEADIILANTPAVEAYKKKQSDLSALESQEKAILDGVGGEKKYLTKEEKEALESIESRRAEISSSITSEEKKANEDYNNALARKRKVESGEIISPSYGNIQKDLDDCKRNPSLDKCSSVERLNEKIEAKKRAAAEAKKALDAKKQAEEAYESAKIKKDIACNGAEVNKFTCEDAKKSLSAIETDLKSKKIKLGKAQANIPKIDNEKRVVELDNNISNIKNKVASLCKDDSDSSKCKAAELELAEIEAEKVRTANNIYKEEAEKKYDSCMEVAKDESYCGKIKIKAEKEAKKKAEEAQRKAEEAQRKAEEAQKKKESIENECKNDPDGTKCKKFLSDNCSKNPNKEICKSASSAQTKGGVDACKEAPDGDICKKTKAALCADDKRESKECKAVAGAQKEQKKDNGVKACKESPDGKECNDAKKEACSGTKESKYNNSDPVACAAISKSQKDKKDIDNAEKKAKKACKIDKESVECKEAKEELAALEAKQACEKPESKECSAAQEAELAASTQLATAVKEEKKKALSRLPKVNCIGLPGCVDKNIDKPTPASKKNDLGKVVITNFIGNLIQYVAVIAVIALMISGIMYLISGGEEEKVKKAKTWITWSLVAVLFSTTAWGIVNIVNNLLIK